MKIYLSERPSLLPAGCAPKSVSWPPAHESIVVAAAERAELSGASPVLGQSVLVLKSATGNGSYGTNGFLGSNGIDLVAQRMTTGASGVPPRGRPV